MILRRPLRMRYTGAALLKLPPATRQP